MHPPSQVGLIQHKHTQTLMYRVGFGPTISVFERSKLGTHFRWHVLCDQLKYDSPIWLYTNFQCFYFLYIWEVINSNNTLSEVFPSLFINHSIKSECRSQDSFLSDSNELVSHCRPFGTVVIGQTKSYINNTGRIHYSMLIIPVRGLTIILEGRSHLM
jgi:hypothetical protein